MNPSSHSLPPGLSPLLGILIILGFVCLCLLIAAALVRLATSWVAGFKPSWGKACGAIICSFILSLIANMVISGALGGKIGHPDPGAVLWSILWSIPITFLVQAVTYQAILGGVDEEAISLPQAGLIVLLKGVLGIVPGIALMIMIVTCVLLAGLPGAAQLKQWQAQYGQHGASLPARSAMPSSDPGFNAPAFTTVADAQKEAVRRYPMLGVKGSRMNKAFLDRYRFYQKTKPDFFVDTAWPLTLANEIASDPTTR